MTSASPCAAHSFIDAFEGALIVYGNARAFRFSWGDVMGDVVFPGDGLQAQNS